MSLGNRIYEDYLKKSRLKYYKELLQTAKKNGYRMVGVLEYYEIIVNGRSSTDEKILINRHDIDTSPKVARKLFEIEQSVYGHDGGATYYFRNSTIDKKLISEIEEYGYETGYHYEELASIAKKNKLRNRDDVITAMPEISQLFLADLSWYRKFTNTKSKTVASHGDFVNTFLQLQSYEILKDSKVREQSGIILEAYDEVITKDIKLRAADQDELDKFSEKVVGGIIRGVSDIMILTHPRNWEVDFVSNTKENLTRLVQGLKYRL